jgi:ectoine hydroxylase-related dioxygenase (phytanoyl-CoA dioxygenase family)
MKYSQETPLMSDTSLLLPPIRTRLEEAKNDLDEYGLTRFTSAASPEMLARTRERLVAQAAGEVAEGLAHRDPGSTAYPTEGAANQRVWNLLNKGEVFRDVTVNPIALELIQHLLGQDILLFSITANIARRGGEAQSLHGDQLFAPADIAFPLLANCLWMLDDFTADNGATRVVPKSHRAGRWPSAEAHIETAPATGPAGTMMVWDGRLWHGTGVNRTDSARHGLLVAFCRPFIRSQENHTVSIAPDVLAQCSPQLLTLLGFSPWRALGMIDGGLAQMRHGRPTSYSGELGAAS